MLTKPDLQEQYAQEGLQAEAVAVSGAIGYSLGVRIDDYVLINMQGFLELIDSVGGVTINLDRAVPLPPALPGAKHDIPSSVGPGTVEMDGTLALAFVRSRYADSDYGRTGRQRQLLAALGEQISLPDAIGGFSSVASALSDAVRTSLSPSEFTDLLDTLGDTAAITESVGLVPPLIVPGRPDYDQIRQIVAEVHDGIATGVPSQYAQVPPLITSRARPTPAGVVARRRSWCRRRGRAARRVGGEREQPLSIDSMIVSKSPPRTWCCRARRGTACRR